MAYACRQSKCLEVNEAGTKVRRTAPLPACDETSPSRTIVAIGIPVEKATIESVAEMFSASGSIALIRILRAGNAIPPDVRQCANRNPDILTSICAVVEFEMAESARKALTDFDDDLIRVVELSSRRSTASPSSAALNQKSLSPSRPQTPSSPGIDDSNNRNRNKRRVATKNKYHLQAISKQDAYGSSSEVDEKPFSPYLMRRGDFSSGASSPNHSPQHSGRYVAARHHTNSLSSSLPSSASPSSPSPVRSDFYFGQRQKSASCSEPGTPDSHSPWVRRRLAAVSSAPQSGRSSPFNADNRLSVPTNVLRMPMGPDGTRGFHFLNKPRSASAPEVPLISSTSSSLSPSPMSSLCPSPSPSPLLPLSLSPSPCPV